MRNPARIPELCQLLQRAWERAPDLRLGQLLVGAIDPAQPCPQVFYAEDGLVRRGLERLARDGSPTPDLPSHRDVELDWEEVGDAPATTLRLEHARLASFDAGSLFCQVLELRFAGEYRAGSEGNPDAAAMKELVITQLARTEPDVVLLDLSRLRYGWGDAILRVFEIIAGFDPDYPVETVVRGGPHSASALVSLGVAVHTDAAGALDDAKAKAVRRSADIG